MPRRQEISYYLPPVGMVRGTLYDESADAYVLLEEMRELERLKRLDQLGAVRLAWAGARHTRWEFSVLCLDVIRRAAALPRIALTSRVRLHGNLMVSSYRELLQSWLLLLGVGHVEWTFTAEQALLDAVAHEASRGKRGPFDDLVQSLPSPEGRDWAASVLSDRHVYQFYQLLCFYRIRNARKMAMSDETIDRQLAMLEAYCVERPVESESIRRARALFRRIRRLAFLALDAEFTPSILSVNLGRLLNDDFSLQRVLVASHPAGLDDELEGLHRNLARRIYSGREVLHEIAKRRDSLNTKVLGGLQRTGLRYIVGELATGDLLRGIKGDPSLRVVARLRLDRRLVRLPIGTTIPGRALDLAAQERAAAEWGRLCGTKLVLQAVRDASDEQYILQIHSPKNAQSRAAAIAFCVFWLANFIPRVPVTRADPTPYLVQRWIVGFMAEELVLAALRAAFGSGYRWEWEGSLDGLRAFAVPREFFAESFLTLIDTPGLAPARRSELKASAACGELMKAQLLVAAAANLKAYPQDEVRPCAELDGLIMAVDRRNKELVVQLIEAKDQRRRSAATARDALRKKLNLLIVDDHPYVRYGAARIAKDRRSGRAWAYIRIKYAD